MPEHIFEWLRGVVAQYELANSYVNSPPFSLILQLDAILEQKKAREGGATAHHPPDAGLLRRVDAIHLLIWFIFLNLYYDLRSVLGTISEF